MKRNTHGHRNWGTLRLFMMLLRGVFVCVCVMGDGERETCVLMNHHLEFCGPIDSNRFPSLRHNKPSRGHSLLSSRLLLISVWDQKNKHQSSASGCPPVPQITKVQGAQCLGNVELKAAANSRSERGCSEEEGPATQWRQSDLHQQVLPVVWPD